MDELTKYELIEKYLSDELNQEERKLLDEKMKEDSELKNEIELHAQVTETLRGEAIHDFRNKLNSVDQKWNPSHNNSGGGKTIRLNFRRILSMAAGLAFLFAAAYLFFSEDNSGSNLFSKNFEPYQMVLNQRSNNQTGEETNIMNEAIQQYANGNFAEAAQSFAFLQNTHPENIAYAFYRAVALLGNDDSENAIPLFEKILDTPDHLFIEQTKWYLGLAHLKNGDSEKAASILKNIQKGEYKYEDAKIILQNLSH